MRHIALGAIALLLAGCASTFLGQHHDRVTAIADAHTRVSFRVVDGVLRVMADGHLNASSAKWVLDTGMSNHLVSPDVAKQHGLFEKPQQGVNGVSITFANQSVGIDGTVTQQDISVPVSVGLFAGAAEPAPILISPIENGLSDVGVVGFLSPERLAPEKGAVELDLVHGNVFRLAEPAANEAREDVARRGSALTECESMGGVHANLPVPMVHATIDGRDVKLMVDTGTPMTMLFADTDVGVEESERGSGHLVSSGSLSAVRLPPTTIRVGGVSQTLRPIVSSHSKHAEGDPDGSLGLDVLRGCTMVLGAGPGAIACRPVEGDGGEADFIATLKPDVLPGPLPIARQPLPKGALARLGCETLSEHDLTAWMAARNIPRDVAARAFLRFRAFTRLMTSSGGSPADMVTEEDVDRAIGDIREQINLDEAGFNAILAERRITPEAYRDDMRESLLERKVTADLVPSDELGGADDAAREKAMERAVDALAAKMLDRYARVPLVQDVEGCHEVWPAFYADGVRVFGLSKEDETAVRRVIARDLGGYRLSLGVDDAVPLDSFLIRDIQAIFEKRGQTATILTHEDGATVRFDVKLLPKRS